MELFIINSAEFLWVVAVIAFVLTAGGWIGERFDD